MSCLADNFEDEFTQVFSTETLVGSGVRLVGLSLRDVECGDGSMAENGRMSPEVVLQRVRDSEEFLAEHLPWVRGATVPEIAKRMRSWIFAEQYGQGGCWGIFVTARSCDKELSGETATDSSGEQASACCRSENSPLAGFIMAEFNLKNHSATFSYWLFPEFTGRGLMTDAVKTLSRYCFDVLKLNRLELSVSITNEKSSAVATRAGFKEEGINRDFERINGIFVDHRRFSLLRRDIC